MKYFSYINKLMKTAKRIKKKTMFTIFYLYLICTIEL